MSWKVPFLVVLGFITLAKPVFADENPTPQPQPKPEAQAPADLPFAEPEIAGTELPDGVTANCDLIIEQYAAVAQLKDREVGSQIVADAERDAGRIFQILTNADTRLAQAETAAAIGKILKADRPDPLKSLTVMNTTLERLGKQGKLGEQTSLILSRLGLRMRVNSLRDKKVPMLLSTYPYINPDWRALAWDRLPIVGGKLRFYEDQSKPIGTVIAEMRHDVDTQIGDLDLTYTEVQQIISELSSAMELMRRHALKQKVIGLQIKKASENPSLPAQEKQYLGIWASSVLRESAANFQVAATVGAGREDAYKIANGLKRSEVELDLTVTQSLASMGIDAALAHGMNEYTRALQTAQAFKKAAAISRRSFAYSYLEAVRLEEDLLNNKSVEKIYAAADIAIKKAAGIEDKIIKDRTELNEKEIKQFEDRIAAYESSAAKFSQEVQATITAGSERRINLLEDLSVTSGESTPAAGGATGTSQP